MRQSLFFLVLMAAAAPAATRPPAIDPNTIPAAIDANQCGGEIIAWRQGLKERGLSFDFKVSITIADPNVDVNSVALDVTVSRGTVTPFDPNARTVAGGEAVDTYRLTHVRGVATVEYCDVTVTCPSYGTSDTRTVIFIFTEPPSPVIFLARATGHWWPKAGAYMADAGVPQATRARDFQRGHKAGGLGRWQDKERRITAAYLAGMNYDGKLEIPEGYCEE